MVLSATGSSLVRRLRERYAQRLEDRLEYMLGVGAVEQAHMQRQPGAFRKALEEAARDIGAKTANGALP